MVDGVSAMPHYYFPADDFKAKFRREKMKYKFVLLAGGILNNQRGSKHCLF
jgi:hypothetical protein